jgi:hypothetical protein
MPNADDVLWFKLQFHDEIAAAIAGLPFDVDMLTALACQETGEIWPILRRKNLTRDRVLALCVGDTLDADKGRAAFPKTKADLIAAPRGQEMFDIAHEALVDMAEFIPGYKGAAANPNKFCHGYGIFQFDLQFFKAEPEYFLEKRYEQFPETLGTALAELRTALKKVGLEDRDSLTDLEMASVAIAYNTGRFKPNLGLKQGFFDGTKFYGESYFDFLRLSRTVALPGGTPSIEPPGPGTAVVAPPTPISATGDFFEVSTLQSTLRVRSEPKISSPDPTSNVVGELPDGQRVRAVTGTPVKGFLEIETSLNGALIHGFAATKFLKPAAPAEIKLVVPAKTPPANGIVAVFMPRKEGAVTRRADLADAHSLNENGQPGRTGTAPDELRAEIADIIAWLAVDKASNKRYQPRDGLTFCNIYAHDFCFLAGVYVPRVWWSGKAIAALARGETVVPLIGDTINEMRANALFGWLRDFGPDFGWRQTGTLTKLQTEVDQGAIGLIVAERKDGSRPGHIAVVVPETEDERARRVASGDVIAPLQSQAGSINFQYGTGKTAWWMGEQFAQSAFWLHG